MSARREIRTCDEADLEDVLRERAVAFGPVPAAAAEGIRERVRDRLRYTLGSFEDGRLASSATMLPFEATIGGSRQRMGGLASVATAPWARRRGHVAGLLRAWLERLHADGVGWCAEHPFDPRFYARYGFQSVPNGQVVELPPSLLPQGRPPDASPLEVGDPATPGRLRAVHAAFAARYSFALTRDDAARDGWGLALHPWGHPDPRVYLLDDAYVVLALADGHDGNTLWATDVAYASAGGRGRLWRFLRAFEGQVERVRLHLPPGEPLLVDWQGRHGRRTPVLQVRVADVRAALTALRAPRQGLWRVRIHDELCPWNEGVFEMDLGPDGCTALPGSGRPDAELHVGALAALLGHAATPELMVADGRAAGELAALHALAELTRGQPPFVAEADGF